MEENNNTVKGENSKNNKKSGFEWNKRYLTMCFYTVIAVFFSVVIIKVVVSWNAVWTQLKVYWGMLTPFIIGAFIAYLINPFVKFNDRSIYGKASFFRKRDKLRKVLSILTAYILTIGILVLGMVYVVPQIGISITELVGLIITWVGNSNEWLVEIEAKHPDFDFESINALVAKYTPQVMDFSKNLVTNVVPLIFATSMNIVKIVLNGLIAIMVSFYMVSDKRIIKKGFKRMVYALVSENMGDFMMETLSECGRIFGQFVFGKAIDSFIIGCLCFVFMTIFSMPFALLISIIVAVTNMIPYFGPFIGAVPGILFILIVDPLKALFFLILIIVLQQFDGLFLGPKILGETVGLRPLWIIFAITIGGSLAGVIGMFLGVPLFAVLTYLVNMVIEHLIKKKNVDIEKKIN